MSQSTEPVPGAGPVDPPPRSRVAFERLRERTDELELIISGLLAFALLTVIPLLAGSLRALPI